MKKTRYALTISFFCLCSVTGFAQTKDSVNMPQQIVDSVKKEFKAPVRITPINLRDAIFPAVCIAYGVIALYSGALNKFKYTVKNAIYDDGPNHKKINIDNYTAAAPAVSVYVLNIAGFHGKNNLVDRFAIFGIANLIGNGGGFLIKNFSHVLRPDSSDRLSFPSGHTFNAFLGSEFLMKEYRDQSIWIGIAGHVVAAGTAYLRIYNDKHWFNDVVAGAGLGIISTKIAYWVYPSIKHIFFKTGKVGTMVMPAYHDGYYGFSLVHYFDPE